MSEQPLNLNSDELPIISRFWVETMTRCQIGSEAVYNVYQSTCPNRENLALVCIENLYNTQSNTKPYSIRFVHNDLAIGSLFYSQNDQQESICWHSLLPDNNSNAVATMKSTTVGSPCMIMVTPYFKFYPKESEGIKCRIQYLTLFVLSVILLVLLLLLRTDFKSIILVALAIYFILLLYCMCKRIGGCVKREEILRVNSISDDQHVATIWWASNIFFWSQTAIDIECYRPINTDELMALISAIIRFNRNKQYKHKENIKNSV